MSAPKLSSACCGSPVRATSTRTAATKSHAPNLAGAAVLRHPVYHPLHHGQVRSERLESLSFRGSFLGHPLALYWFMSYLDCFFNPVGDVLPRYKNTRIVLSL